jgi:hypothetical protein
MEVRMVTRMLEDDGRKSHSTSQPVGRGNQRRRRGARAGGREPEIAPAERLHEAIEIERDNLSKAESLLGCVAISMEHGAEYAREPYYPDLVDMARELVRGAINGLDAVSLQKYVLRNKIKEGEIAREGIEATRMIEWRPEGAMN